MKLTIKHSNGSTIDIDGTQEECLAALKALFDQPPVFLTGMQVLPAAPVLQPLSPSLPVTPWAPSPYQPYQPYQPPQQPYTVPTWPPVTIWRATEEQIGVEGVCRPPFSHGDILMPYRPNQGLDHHPIGSTSTPAGFQVDIKDLEMSLQPLSQAQVWERMGMTWVSDFMKGSGTCCNNDPAGTNLTDILGRTASGLPIHTSGFIRPVEGSERAV